MERWILRASLLTGVLVGLVALAWASGNRASVDEVALATKETGTAFESRTLSLGDIELHVVLVGPEQGPKVLLLHGFPEFWYTWHAQMAMLANAGYRVAAPDTRGANRSGKPSDAALYTDHRLADDVIGILDGLGWERAFLAGHDVGGGTAWQLVFEAPDRFRAAVIFNTPHPMTWGQARPEDDDESVSWFRSFFQLPVLPELVARAGDYRGAPLSRVAG